MKTISVLFTRGNLPGELNHFHSHHQRHRLLTLPASRGLFARPDGIVDFARHLFRLTVLVVMDSVECIQLSGLLTAF